MMTFCVCPDLSYNARMAIGYLTPAQVAERCQLDRETIYRYLLSGKLRGVKISSKCWRVLESNVDAFLNGKKQA